jgi:hypothetical protein
MELIEFILSLIMAYILGIVLFYTFISVIAVVGLIITGIYFAFKWITSHFIEVSLSLIAAAAVIYLIRLVIKKRFIPRAYNKAKSLTLTGCKKGISLLEPIKRWNEKHKPKDIKSMRKYGFTSFLVGIAGTILFYLNGLWIVSLFYVLWIISGIYQMIYPDKALKRFNQ